MTKVSVVVPTFNSGKYIRETLLSILAQDYQDFEIIVVDDASTDNTAEVVKALNSDKIHYIRQSENHGGPSKPRNVGIKNAQGEYIAIFDSDDLMLPGRIQSAANAMDRMPDVGMVFTDAIKFDDINGDYAENHLKHYDRFNSLKTTCFDTNFFIIDKQQAYNCLFYENYVQTSSVTIRKKIFEEIGCFDESLTNADDWDMWFRISKCYDLGFLDSLYVRYRIREGSISTRAAKLGNNKINVLRKNFNTELDPGTRNQVRSLIATNYTSIGYFYRCGNQMQLARTHYMLSLKEKLSWSILVQWMITFLGHNAINALRKVKNKITSQCELS